MIKKIFFVVIVIALAISAGLYIKKDLKKTQEIVIDQKGTTTSSGNVTITPVPVPQTKRQVPALPFPPIIKAQLSDESKVLAMGAIKEDTDILKKDSSDESRWIDLGLQRNFIGDYNGAREAWEYASYLRPNDFIPLHNLGDLYAYSLNDYAKSEMYYRKSIAADPSQLIVYQKLYELYRFKIKDNVKARAILEDGIAKNPATSAWLKKILDEFNSSSGQ